MNVTWYSWHICNRTALKTSFHYIVCIINWGLIECQLNFIMFQLNLNWVSIEFQLIFYYKLQLKSPVTGRALSTLHSLITFQAPIAIASIYKTTFTTRCYVHPAPMPVTFLSPSVRNQFQSCHRLHRRRWRVADCDILMGDPLNCSTTIAFTCVYLQHLSSRLPNLVARRSTQEAQWPLRFAFDLRTVPPRHPFLVGIASSGGKSCVEEARASGSVSRRLLEQRESELRHFNRCRTLC